VAPLKAPNFQRLARKFCTDEATAGPERRALGLEGGSLEAFVGQEVNGAKGEAQDEFWRVFWPWRR